MPGRPVKRAKCFWCGVGLLWSTWRYIWYGVDHSTSCPATGGLHLAQELEPAVVHGLASIDHLPLAFDMQDAIVGMAVFLAADEVTALIDNGCPVCFLAERVRDPFAYDGLIAIAARHVLGGAS